jgi:hypothetical protein
MSKTILVGSLTKEEVKERLASVTEPSVTNELYDLGKLLIAETQDRFKSLDGKAATIAAYSIGVITLLASTRSSWSQASHLWSARAVFVGGVISLIATMFAVWALTLKQYQWFSENVWIKADCLKDAERLRLYHILAMWTIVDAHNSVCETKASRIAWAQWLLLAGAVVLALSLGDVIVLRFPGAAIINIW